MSNNAPQKADMKMRASFMGIMTNYVMAQSGCMMMSCGRSFIFQIKQDVAKGTMDIAMKQSFIGDIQRIPIIARC
ncbi:MAG: hypothetical protein R3E67_08070 [Pseudomonadales bacterium]